MSPLPTPQDLRWLFAGLTEQTFICELGVADTQLIDYLSSLLTRFVHRDAIFALKGPRGRQLKELADMMLEAEQPSHDSEERHEMFRHIGDFALFWSGMYPEALGKGPAWAKKDALISYTHEGKRCYYMASTYSDTPSQAEQAPVLRRLSDDFEMWAYGLSKVRRHWEA